MSRVIRFVLAALVAGLVLPAVGGCEQKNEGQPSPDRKVPDAPGRVPGEKDKKK